MIEKKTGIALYAINLWSLFALPYFQSRQELALKQ